MPPTKPVNSKLLSASIMKNKGPSKQPKPIANRLPQGFTSVNVSKKNKGLMNTKAKVTGVGTQPAT